MYHKVIIGTSPLSFMLAIKLKEECERVLILEKELQKGGAWKENKVENIKFDVENTCHLIENYIGVYSIIEGLSGCKFISCNPQPIKKFNNNSTVKYDSLITKTKSFLRNISILPVVYIFKSINYFLPEKYKIKKASTVNPHTLIRNIKFFLFYQLPLKKKYRYIKEPENGYSTLTSSLESRAEKNGVDIMIGELYDIKETNDCLTLYFSNGKKILCDSLYLPESTEIDAIPILNSVVNKNNKKTKYWHVLVKVNEGSRISDMPSYIHFPDNLKFHRITHDKNNNENGYFLVQTRISPACFENIKLSIAELLYKCGFYSNAPLIQIVSEFSESFYASNIESPLSYLRQPTTTKRIVIFPSIGDVSRNIIANKYFNQLNNKVDL